MTLLVSKALCLSTDIDECKLIPGVCVNGVCFNTMGSYRCHCELGYMASTAGTMCVGMPQTLSFITIGLSNPPDVWTEGLLFAIP